MIGMGNVPASAGGGGIISKIVSVTTSWDSGDSYYKDLTLSESVDVNKSMVMSVMISSTYTGDDYQGGMTGAYLVDGDTVRIYRGASSGAGPSLLLKIVEFESVVNRWAGQTTFAANVPSTYVTLSGVNDYSKCFVKCSRGITTTSAYAKGDINGYVASNGRAYFYKTYYHAFRLCYEVLEFE